MKDNDCFNPTLPHHLLGAPFNAQKFIARQSVMFLSEGLKKRDDFGMCAFHGLPFIRTCEGIGQDLYRPREKTTDLHRHPDAAPGWWLPPGQPLSERKTVRTPDLEGESILLSKVDCSYRRTLERLLNEAGVANENVHIFHSVEALKRCVIKGAGITILSEVAVRENLVGGDLVALNWEEQGFDAAPIMIWYGERWRSPALEAFMATTRDVPRGYYEGS
jgi:hypothetical protein